MNLIMPPPKEAKSKACAPKSVRSRVSSDGLEVFTFPSAKQLAGVEESSERVRAGSEANEGKDPPSVLYESVCSVRHARKWVKRKEVEYVMAVKIAPVEPIVNAQSVGVYHDATVPMPSAH